MEKLIELLNEWANQMMPGWSEYYSKGDNIYLKFKAPLNGEGKIENEVICSKRYEFIKWLVERDKIKLGAYDVEGYHFNIHTYLDLIMLLAISDTPIDDLISYLK